MGETVQSGGAKYLTWSCPDGPRWCRGNRNPSPLRGSGGRRCNPPTLPNDL